jgi:hypothetical protein
LGELQLHPDRYRTYSYSCSADAKPNPDADRTDADPDTNPNSDPNRDRGRPDANPDAHPDSDPDPHADLLGTDPNPDADDASSLLNRAWARRLRAAESGCSRQSELWPNWSPCLMQPQLRFSA